MIGEAGFDENGSPELDDFSFGDIQNLRGAFKEGAVKRLWEYCEVSDGEVKLILPDTVHVPFYLPQPRTHKDPELEEARQRRRLEQSITNIAASSSHGGGKRSLQQIGTFHHLNARELNIEAKLMSRYRDHPDLAKDMIKKFRHSSLGKHRQIKPYTLKNKDDYLSLSPRRHDLAQARKSEIDSQRQATSLIDEQKWLEKIKQQEEVHQEIHTILYQRQCVWLTHIAGLLRLRKFYNIVARVRELKQQNYRRWNSAIRVQRIFRHFLYNVRKKHLPAARAYSPRAKENTIDKIKRHLQSTNQVVHTFSERQRACIIIMDSLRLISKTWKSILLGFVRKVRIIQQRFRRHREYNTQRVELINIYLERVYPAFFAHTQMILSGKGHDLQNLLSMDINRLQEATRSYKRYAAVDGLLTPGVHALLRAKANIVRLVSRFFGPAAKLHLYDISSVRRQVILQHLFKKRYQFVTQSSALKRIAIHPKKFNHEDVRAFIRGGQDPLHQHLSTEQDLQDRAFTEYISKKSKEKTNDAFKKYSLSQTMMCLFSATTAEELCGLYLQITQQATDLVSAARAKAASRSNSGDGSGTPTRGIKPSSAASMMSGDGSDGRKPSLKESTGLPFAALLASGATGPPTTGLRMRKKSLFRASMDRIESMRGMEVDDDDASVPSTGQLSRRGSVRSPMKETSFRMPETPPKGSLAKAPSKRGAMLSESPSKAGSSRRGKALVDAKESAGGGWARQPQPPAQLKPSRLIIP